jgi:hypothetical protein
MFTYRWTHCLIVRPQRYSLEAVIVAELVWTHRPILPLDQVIVVITAAPIVTALLRGIDAASLLQFRSTLMVTVALVLVVLRGIGLVLIVSIFPILLLLILQHAMRNV